MNHTIPDCTCSRRRRAAQPRDPRRDDAIETPRGTGLAQSICSVLSFASIDDACPNSKRSVRRANSFFSRRRRRRRREDHFLRAGIVRASDCASVVKLSCRRRCQGCERRCVPCHRKEAVLTGLRRSRSLARCCSVVLLRFVSVQERRRCKEEHCSRLRFLRHLASRDKMDR